PRGARRDTGRAEDRGHRDGATAAARRREDLQARWRCEGRGRAGREGAARGGQGPVTKILVVADRKDGQLRRVTSEIAAKAASFGDIEVIAVKGERYSPIAWSSAVAEKAKASGAQLVLTGATL